MQTANIDELIKRFHFIARTRLKASWAYEKRKPDMQQEAWLCAIQCQYLSYQDYAREATRRIRKLLKGFGFREACGKCDPLVPPSLMELFALDEYVLKYLKCHIRRIPPSRKK